ncbi:MAG TPA: hypothetical protein VKF14_05885 [Candidatus Dormibacteraeota bacterium]|nr:hypothetical protein [Candidatus Dormibacteraeota bacterium]
MVETHDALRPLYRIMLALGLVSVVILALGFALLLRFAPPGQHSGYRAHISGVYAYDPATGSITGSAMTRFHRDQPFAASVDWKTLPASMLVSARWTDSLDDEVGATQPTPVPAGRLASQDALVPVRASPAFHANLPGRYTLTVVRYAGGQPVELLAMARVTVLRDP